MWSACVFLLAQIVVCQFATENPTTLTTEEQTVSSFYALSSAPSPAPIMLRLGNSTIDSTKSFKVPQPSPNPTSQATDRPSVIGKVVVPHVVSVVRNTYFDHDRRYGPTFEDVPDGNVTKITVQLGEDAHLNCRISLLQDKTIESVFCCLADARTEGGDCERPRASTRSCEPLHPPADGVFSAARPTREQRAATASDHARQPGRASHCIHQRMESVLCCPADARTEGGHCERPRASTPSCEPLHSPMESVLCCPADVRTEGGHCERPRASTPSCEPLHSPMESVLCCPADARTEGGHCERPRASTPSCEPLHSPMESVLCCPADARTEGGHCERPRASTPSCEPLHSPMESVLCCPADVRTEGGHCERPRASTPSCEPLHSPMESVLCCPADVRTEGGHCERPRASTPSCEPLHSPMESVLCCPADVRTEGGHCERPRASTPSCEPLHSPMESVLCCPADVRTEGGHCERPRASTPSCEPLHSPMESVLCCPADARTEGGHCERPRASTPSCEPLHSPMESVLCCPADARTEGGHCERPRASTPSCEPLHSPMESVLCCPADVRTEGGHCERPRASTPSCEPLHSPMESVLCCPADVRTEGGHCERPRASTPSCEPLHSPMESVLCCPADARTEGGHCERPRASTPSCEPLHSPVNNHGVLSFRADIPSFMNAEFPLPYPTIAAFYSNVDTSATGAVYYRETAENRVLVKAEESVQNNFHEYYDFRPTSVFIVTWAGVSYTGAQGNPRNTYQAAIISNGNESFVELLYPDGDIQWIQRETSPDSLPDAKAQAGFVSEEGQMLLLRGSGSHQIRNIVAWSNTHEPGKYVYRVGNILQDGGNIVVPDLYDQSEEEVEEESRTCAQSGPSVCHTEARCVDYLAGICCQCNEGYYGNGKACVKNDVPLRVHGKLNGVINDVSLNDVDIQAYVVVADGRSYTALSQAPAALGNSLQLVHVLGGVIGWLFAKPLGYASNGYQLTGAVFNHTVDIFFPATQNRVTVVQEFVGHDVFDQITLDCDIRGSLPQVGAGAKLQISEYEEQYTVIEPGLIRSESTRTLTDKLTGVNYEQRILQTIKYNPCRFAPPEGTVSSSLKVSKNYLGYEPKNNIVRYGMSNKIVPLGQEDPCIFGRSTCGPHSSCIVQGSSFACVCQSGFSNTYEDGAVVCVDIDECAASTHNCDTNADCYNHEGGFQCRCRDGFEGNGISCSRVSQCRDKSCNQFASCVEGYGGGEPTCVCNAGYTGDGQRCWVINAYTCDVLHNCSPYASCIFSQVSNSHICQCGPGYVGDGHYCSVDTQTHPGTLPSITTTSQPSTNVPENEFLTNESANQESANNEFDTVGFVLPNCDIFGCTCPEGYSSFFDQKNNEYCRLDGYSDPHLIQKNDTSITCNNDADCPPNAVCKVTLEPDGLYVRHCVCPEGTIANSYECVEQPNDPCNCGPNAHCYQTGNGAICVCDASYHGDGYSCRPKLICTNSSECESHAECRLDSNSNEFVCQCIEGYIKDENEACIPDRQLCNGAVCPKHSSCLYDSTLQVGYCACDPGYEGNGVFECLPKQLDRQLCNGAVCREHSSCLFDSTLGADYCACDTGYEGDGFYECLPKQDQDKSTIRTCDVAHDCNENAVCTFTEVSYQCICRDGYVGDGYDCRPEPNCRNDPYMCDVHASCIKRNQEYVCECNSGYSEIAYGNESRCELNPRQAGNFLVASDGVVVYRVPFMPSARDYATPINSANDQIAVGIDTDCQTGKVYWGDVVSNSIKRASYDGSEFELFLSNGIKSPEGVAIDWASRNIFWTDSKKFTIEVANLDTKVRKVLFAIDNIKNPRGIAVHPRRGKVFWSDWNRANPKIEWANMDGSQRGVFVDNTDVKLPNSLAIDWLKDRLCYTDAGLFLIKCVSLNTMETETIVTNCLYPFGLAINRETFYWTDWKTLKIENIDTLTQQKGQVSIAPSSNKLYGVAVAPNECPDSTNVCAFRNGNCDADQLCLPDGRGGRTCVAGDQTYGY